MGTICLQCGDKGSTNAFVYCVKCLNFAVHRYCLDVIPETLDEFVHWLCDDCDEVHHKSVVRFNHDVIPSQTRNHIVSEKVKGTEDHIVPNKTKKNDLLVVSKEEHVQNDGPESNNACAKVDLVNCRISDKELALTQVGVEKDDDHDMLLPADERKICPKENGNLVRQTRLLKRASKKIKKKKGNRIKPVKEKDEHSLDNNASCKKESKEGVKIPCGTKLPSSKVRDNKASKQRDHKRISMKSSKKKKKKTIILSKENLLENKELVSGNQCAEEKTGFECDTKLHCKLKEDNKGSEHQQRDKKRISVKISKMKKRKTFILSENKPLNLGNPCAEKSTEEKKCSPSKKAHIGNGELEDRGERNFTNIDKNNISEDFPKDLHMSAEPVAMPIWRGSFSIVNEKRGILLRLLAHVSVLACHKVYDEALQFKPVLHLEMLPKSVVWPKSFETLEPRGDNIALYFFPSKSSEQDFDRLVDDMMRKELALKASVQNAELLIFDSSELPLLYWKFQGKYYLWGVFRQKQSSDSHPKDKNPIQHTTDKTSVTLEGLDALSPRSPLSNSASYDSRT